MDERIVRKVLCHVMADCTEILLIFGEDVFVSPSRNEHLSFLVGRARKTGQIRHFMEPLTYQRDWYDQLSISFVSGSPRELYRPFGQRLGCYIEGFHQAEEAAPWVSSGSYRLGLGLLWIPEFGQTVKVPKLTLLEGLPNKCIPCCIPESPARETLSQVVGRSELGLRGYSIA